VIGSLTVAWVAIALSPADLQDQLVQFLTVTAAAGLPATVGALDDIRSLSVTTILALDKR
jgi:hypothetical protein